MWLYCQLFEYLAPTRCRSAPVGWTYMGGRDDCERPPEERVASSTGALERIIAKMEGEGADFIFNVWSDDL